MYLVASSCTASPTDRVSLSVTKSPTPLSCVEQPPNPHSRLWGSQNPQGSSLTNAQASASLSVGALCRGHYLV